MSANNELVIYQTKDEKYCIKHVDLDCGDYSDEFPICNTLEEAVKECNKFMEDREVEYGMRIMI